MGFSGKYIFFTLQIIQTQLNRSNFRKNTTQFSSVQFLEKVAYECILISTGSHCCNRLLILHAICVTFKHSIGPTKNLERHYNWVVVRLFVWLVGWLVATLVITASSHSKLCHTDQTRQIN